MTIIVDSMRLSNRAAEDMTVQEANDWNFDHSTCSRCGTACHWSEHNDDGTCSVCEGHEVEGENE